jgi:predicted ATPase
VLRELVGLGHRGVPEAARETIAEQRAISGQGVYDRDPALFVQLMLERALTDLGSAASSEQPVFFDRGIPDLVGYCQLFDLDPTRAWEAARLHRYNNVVFAMPPWPEIYTTDADRKMTFEFAAAFGRHVLTVYEELGYSVVDVPRSSPAERARFIRDQVARGESDES